MADKQMPRLAERGNRKADAHHRGPKHHGPAHPDALGDASHQDAADADPDPTEGPGKRGRLAGAAEIGRDGLE